MMAAKITGVDMDVINSIIEANTEKPKSEPKVAPLAPAKVFKLLGDKKKTKPFSEVFGWKPETIPDIPVPVFEAEDWEPEAQLMIPTMNPHWVWNRPVTEKAALAMMCGDTTLMYGLHGTGKSALPEAIAALCNIPLWRMSCNTETRETHFVGSPSVEYNAKDQMVIRQEPTILTDSLKYGGIFLEDEAFRHNSAMVLQALREKNNRTLLLPDAPGRTAAERKLKAPVGKWWYFMTDNTVGVGDETGIYDAFVQDASTLDRIDTTIEVPYLSVGDERTILKSACSLPDDMIRNMTAFAVTIRKAFQAGTIMSTFSIRPLLTWAEKTEILGDSASALRMCWYDKLSKDDQAVAKDAYFQQFAIKL